MLQGTLALLLAIAVHLGGFGLLWLGSQNWQPRKPPEVAAFTLVDAAPMVRRQEREQLAEQQAEAARQALEQARLDERARQQEQALQQAERDRQEEQQRQTLLERQRQEQLAREQEQARQLEEQRQLDRERREAEQQRMRELEELRRQREQAEADRREQERRLAELAEQREAERRRLEAEAEAERLRLAREQAAQTERRATLRDEYVLTIAELVRRNWIRPSTTNPGVQCAVQVVQIPGGDIIDQAIVSPCNADEVTRRSILAAVERTAVLPYRGYEDVFEREIRFIFRYDGD